MSESLLFLTGKLAEKSLHQVLASIQPAPFKYRITQIGVSVAALMTPELIARRLPDIGDASKVIVPVPVVVVVSFTLSARTSAMIKQYGQDQ